MKILVTGVAGFIGMHTTNRLLHDGNTVVGIDNLNDYYDPKLKEARLATLLEHPSFTFHKLDVANTAAMEDFFAREQFERVVHLAAQAGVRYSITNPHSYAQSNLVGFLNILEGCRQNACSNLVYASSSSVYGGNVKMPFSEGDPVNHPVSIYAATKKANELMAHTYSHLYGLPTTGLRFFTVYGPWGRPDMAYFSFTQDILAGTPIKVFNNGRMKRDFTYIDDIVDSVVFCISNAAVGDKAFDPLKPNPATSPRPFNIFNIGNSQPVDLMEFIAILETCLKRKAIVEMLPMQPGDVVATYADTTALERWAGFRPATSLKDGLGKFSNWYQAYY